MEKKLKRNTQDKMVAGVASGLAQYFQLDVVWVRIAFALAIFFGGGGLWVYIILWIAMPEEDNPVYTYTDYRVNPDETKLDSTFTPTQKSNVSAIVGFLLIGFGGFFLLDEFEIIPHWFNISKLWPLIFVAIGLSIILKNTRKTEKSNPFDPTIHHKKTEEPVNENNDDSNNNNPI